MEDINIPRIAYWMDKPLSELPREVLEEEFIIAHRRIRALETEIGRRSVDHIRLLAQIAQGQGVERRRYSRDFGRKPHPPCPERVANRRAAIGFAIFSAILLGASFAVDQPVLALGAFIFLTGATLIARHG